MSLNDKLELTIQSKIESFASEYASLPKHSLGRRSVDDKAFEYINGLPKEHLRQRYVREYYSLRHKLEREYFEKKDYWGV